MGKGVGEIGRLCRELEVPCAALAGIAQEPASRKLFWTVRTLTDITNLTKARREPARYLEQLAAALAGEFSRSGRRD